MFFHFTVEDLLDPVAVVRVMVAVRLRLPADQDLLIAPRCMLVSLLATPGDGLHRDRRQDQRVGSREDDDTGDNADHSAQLSAGSPGIQ